MRKEPGKSWSSSCIRSVFQSDGGFWFLAMLTGDWNHPALCSMATYGIGECNFCTEMYSLSLTFCQQDFQS